MARRENRFSPRGLKALGIVGGAALVLGGCISPGPNSQYQHPATAQVVAPAPKSDRLPVALAEPAPAPVPAKPAAPDMKAAPAKTASKSSKPSTPAATATVPTPTPAPPASAPTATARAPAATTPAPASAAASTGQPEPLPGAPATGSTASVAKAAPAATNYPNINKPPSEPDGALLSPEERAKMIGELEALRNRQTNGADPDDSSGGNAAQLKAQAAKHGEETIDAIEKCSDPSTASTDPDCKLPAD